MFDYEAFGEGEDTLEFEEGDLIEVSGVIVLVYQSRIISPPLL